MEQRREPMDKNRIGGILRWTSWQMTAESISIKGAGCKSGGCASKAVERKRQGKPSMQVDSGLLADGKPGGRCEVNELAMRAIGKTGEYGLQVFAHRDF